jgi:hypothetical protein
LSKPVIERIMGVVDPEPPPRSDEEPRKLDK